MNKSKRGSALRWSLIASVVVVALIGTYLFGKAKSLAQARAQVGRSASGKDGPTQQASADTGADWIISKSTDPMTDVSLAQAALPVAGQQYDAEVTVSCGSDGNLSYTVASFDKDRKPAEMRMREVPFGDLAGTWIDYEMRADDKPAQSLSAHNPAYNNQIVLSSHTINPTYADGRMQYADGLDQEPAEQMAAASVVTLRLFMTGGEETFQLPQSEPAFRNVVRPCLNQRQATRSRVTQEWNQELARRRQEYDARVRSMNDPGTANTVSAM